MPSFCSPRHREPHTEDLARAEMAVSLFRVAKIFVEGFHWSSCQLSAVSLQLNIRRGDRVAHFLRQRIPSLVISTRIPAFGEFRARMRPTP